MDPCVAMYQSVAQSECLRAADAAEAAYSAAFPKEVSADEKLLEKEHQVSHPTPKILLIGDSPFNSKSTNIFHRRMSYAHAHAL